MTLNLNALAGSKTFFNTSFKLKESENESKNKSVSEKKAAKLKLLQKLNRTQFVELENNDVSRYKNIMLDRKKEVSNEANLNKLDVKVNKYDSNEGVDLRLAKLINKSNVEKATKELNYPFKKNEQIPEPAQKKYFLLSCV